jgi:excisionase family DNA binding protein
MDIPQQPQHDPAILAVKVEEAARRLQVGRTTMYALIKDGEIPTVPVRGARRVPVSALIAYLASHSSTCTSEAA